MCENAKLKPTPAVFQLDFVCNDKLATPPKSYKGTRADDMPSGCSFHCRDKFTTSMCEEQAKLGACAKHAKGMHFYCASTCGVCKGIGMTSVDHDALPLPACAKKDPEDEGCGGWAKSGECVKNVDYMKESCPFACGLCTEEGQALVSMDAALKTSQPRSSSGGKKKGKKGKKGKKAAGAGAAAGENADAAADPTPAEAADNDLPEVRAAPASGGAASTGEARKEEL